MHHGWSIAPASLVPPVCLREYTPHCELRDTIVRGQSRDQLVILHRCAGSLCACSIPQGASMLLVWPMRLAPFASGRLLHTPVLQAAFCTNADWLERVAPQCPAIRGHYGDMGACHSVRSRVISTDLPRAGRRRRLHSKLPRVSTAGARRLRYRVCRISGRYCAAPGSHERLVVCLPSLCGESPRYVGSMCGDRR